MHMDFGFCGCVVDVIPEKGSTTKHVVINLSRYKSVKIVTKLRLIEKMSFGIFLRFMVHKEYCCCTVFH